MNRDPQQLWGSAWKDMAVNFRIGRTCFQQYKI